MGHMRIYTLRAKEIGVDRKNGIGAWVEFTGPALGNASPLTDYHFNAFLTERQILELYNKLRATWTETEQK